MRIQPALAEEATAIAEVWLRARRAAVSAIPPPVHTDDDVRSWFREVVVASREVWIAEDGGGVVGLLVLDGNWIDQLYVVPERTGHGIGAMLLATAKRQRPDGLRLWTFATNVRAQAFYVRHGFVATDATDGDNEEGAPDIRYVWSPTSDAAPAR